MRFHWRPWPVNRALGTVQSVWSECKKGYFIVDCYAAGIKALVPKVDTTGREARGRYSKADFRYDAEQNEYRCPAGQRLTYRFDSVEHGMRLWVYETNQCTSCPLQTKCTTSDARRIKRWEYEAVLDAAEVELKQQPDAMRQRKRLVEHPYGSTAISLSVTKIQRVL